MPPKRSKQPSGRGSLKLGALSASIKKKLKDAKFIEWSEGATDSDVINGTIESSLPGYRKKVEALAKIKGLRDLNVAMRGFPRPEFVQIRFTIEEGANF